MRVLGEWTGLPDKIDESEKELSEREYLATKPTNTDIIGELLRKLKPPKSPSLLG
jgi:hypothetical protein